MPSLVKNKSNDPLESQGLISNPETPFQAAEERLSRRQASNVRNRIRTNMKNRKKTLIKICVIVLLFSLLLIWQYGSYSERSRPNKLLPSENLELSTPKMELNLPNVSSSTKLQLNLPHCQIPRINPNSKHYSVEDVQLKSCDKEETFSTLENEVLTLEGFGLHSNCCVSEIVRPYELPSDSFVNKPCISFNGSTSMNVSGKEFINVNCKNGDKTKYDFHATVVPRADYLKEKIAYWQQKKEMPINVLVLVLDSTSRTDAFRRLPKTMKYLLQVLDFVEFKGYHNLGEATMQNAIPLLLGIPTVDYNGKVKSWTETWDNTPFIWKEFSNSNYATAYIEDIPGIGTFNYGGQTGFTFKPTDFYLRPFFSASLVDNRYSEEKVCVGKASVEKYLLDYQLEMLRKMNGLVPVFSMPWPCWPQHDFEGTLQYIEDTTYNFFKGLKDSDGLLENTLIIVMADHSFYGGKYAQTHEGLLERRLPPFLIRLPSKLTSKYPEFAREIQKNANRITSHYDVHQTLLHIAHLSRTEITPKNEILQVDKKFGQSLFKSIPSSRTCSEAGIPPKVCACNLPLPPDENGNSTVVVPSIMKLKLK